MTTLATGLIGAAVGGVIGAPGLGFSLGAALGHSFLGGRGQRSYTHQEGSRLSDLKVQSSHVGVMIHVVYVTYRIAGNLIWETDIVEHSNTTTQTQHLGGGGKGGHHHDNMVTQTTTTYNYSANFAIGLCQGVISGIRRIWADGKLIYNTGSQASAQTLISSQLRAKQLRLYKGTADQLPDPLIEAFAFYPARKRKNAAERGTPSRPSQCDRRSHHHLDTAYPSARRLARFCRDAARSRNHRL
jgi:hypothetical protein